jgi:hypothetical protein
MTHPSLQAVPALVRLHVAQLAAEIIERAASFGEDCWGLTPYSDGFRVNVGWTEILTALPACIRLVVDGDRARAVARSEGFNLVEGEDSRGFNPSVPGSDLAEIPYEPLTVLERATVALRPALMEAISLAARRRSGRGVKQGHRQEAVSALASLVGKRLPIPGYAAASAVDSSAGVLLMEGALRRAVSSEYERNPAARRACIEHYGTSCFVCGFSFAEKYGELGRGFIHVHHLTPLSSIGSEYCVDPIADLRPVCPNCHAMLHCQDPSLAIEELRACMSESEIA